MLQTARKEENSGKKNKRIVLHGYGFLQEKGKGKEVGGTGLGRRHIGITQKIPYVKKKTSLI